MAPTVDVAVYTLARKFPKLIGKFVNGKPIPFGPFTYLQVGALVGGVITLMTVISVFDPPKIPALFIGSAILAPAVVAVRRIGFSMARTSSRLIWSSRPWIHRTPLSTGGRTVTAAPQISPTGARHGAFETEQLC